MLYNVIDTYTNGFTHHILDIYAIIAIFFGVFVITSKSPVISILFLISLFGTISIYLFTINLTFIGLVYLLVYVGAVSILFLFILMLINVRISELYSGTSNSLPLAIIISILFLLPVSPITPDGSFISHFTQDNLYVAFTALTQSLVYGFTNISGDISYVTSVLWDGNITQSTHITSIGNIMFTNYAIWIIITSFILLLAMLGAIVITIKQK